MKRWLALLLTLVLTVLSLTIAQAATYTVEEDGDYNIENMTLYPEVFNGYPGYSEIASDNVTAARFAALLIRETASALPKSVFNTDNILDVYVVGTDSSVWTCVFFSNKYWWLWPIGTSYINTSQWTGSYSTSSARSGDISNLKSWGIITGSKLIDKTLLEEAMAWEPPTTASMLANGDYEGLFRSAGSVSAGYCGWFRFQKNYVGGYVNKDGAFMLDNWNYASAFNEASGLASVYRGEMNTGSFSYPKSENGHPLGQYGVIDTEGNVVFDMIYDSVEFSNEGLVRLRTYDEKYLLYNGITREQIDVSDYDYVQVSSSDGLLQVFKGTLGTYHSPDTGLYGYINLDGELVLPVEFEGCGTTWKDGLTTVRKNDKNGLMDKTGTIVVPCVWDSIEVSSIANGTAIAKRKDLAYLIDITNGAILYSFNAKYVSRRGDYFAVYDTFDNDEGLMDQNFNMVLKREWYGLYLADGSDSLWVVSKKKDDGSYSSLNGVMDLTTGEMKVPLLYDSLSSSLNGGLRTYKQNGYWGYMNDQFQIMIPASYDDSTAFVDGCAAVKENGSWCLIDQYGLTLY